MFRFVFVLVLVSFTLRTVASDTLRPVSFSDSCALTGIFPDLVTYKTPLGGFICGNNVLNTSEKAQKYYWTDSLKMLSAVAFWFGQKIQAPFPGLIRAKVYRVNAANGSPESLLGESNVFSVGNIDTVNHLSVVFFPAPLALPDTFFVSLDLSLLNPGDTVGLLSTRNGCFSGEQLAWEKDSMGIWVPMNDGTNITSWGLDIDMAIFPIGDFGLHTSAPTLRKNDMWVYPIPAAEKVRIALGNELPLLSLRIVNAHGEIVYQEKEIRKYPHEIAIAAFPPGIYFLEAHNAQTTGVKKLVISR